MWGLSEIRTTESCVSKLILVYLLCLKSATQANHIYVDDIGHQLKIPLLHERHAVVQTGDEFILKATGFSNDEREHIRFKTTFSPDQCDDNASDLFVEGIDLNSKQHRFHLNKGNIMDLLISLRNFSFGDKNTAYVCAKWKNDMKFVHMGANSKFER